MSEHEDGTSKTIDERIAQYLAKQTRTYSRRSALITFGKTLLQLSGLAVIPLLPSAGCSESGGHCGWETCGMCGYICSSGCCGGGGFSRCPSCMFHGGSWSLCCYDPNTCNCNNGTMFTYADCLGLSTTGRANITACRTGEFCGDHPTGNCSGQGGFPYGSNYSCTTVEAGGLCSACGNGVQ